MESGDADFLAASSAVLSGQHGSVRGRLVSVGLDLHSTGDTDDGFLAGKISDVDESVVEGGDWSREHDAKISRVSKMCTPTLTRWLWWWWWLLTDASNAEDELSLSDLGAERDFWLLSADGLWWHGDVG